MTWFLFVKDVWQYWVGTTLKCIGSGVAISVPYAFMFYYWTVLFYVPTYTEEEKGELGEKYKYFKCHERAEWRGEDVEFGLPKRKKVFLRSLLLSSSLPLLQQPQLFNSHCVLLVQNVPEICSTLVPNLQSKVIRNKQDENMILNRERSKAHLNLSLAKDDRLKKMCFLRL